MEKVIIIVYLLVYLGVFTILQTCLNFKFNIIYYVCIIVLLCVVKTSGICILYGFTQCMAFHLIYQPCFFIHALGGTPLQAKRMLSKLGLRPRVFRTNPTIVNITVAVINTLY